MNTSLCVICVASVHVEQCIQVVLDRFHHTCHLYLWGAGGAPTLSPPPVHRYMLSHGRVTRRVYDTSSPANSLLGHLAVLPIGLVIILVKIGKFYFANFYLYQSKCK